MMYEGELRNGLPPAVLRLVADQGRVSCASGANKSDQQQRPPAQTMSSGIGELVGSKSLVGRLVLLKEVIGSSKSLTVR